MAKAKSKKRGTAATRTARKNVATLVKAAEAKKRGNAAPGNEVARTGQTGRDADDGGKPGRRRWKELSTEQLRALYVEKLGRPTASDDRNYLVWKIREAEKGNVPVGPTTRRLFEGPAAAVTVKFEETFLDAFDAAAKDDGFKSRLGYIRDLIGKGLQVRGRSELASKVLG